MPPAADPDRAVERAGRLGWRLFALSFLALFLELLLIRWAPSIVRLVAYYANLLLISSFLGLGLGVMLAARGFRLFRWLAALLLADILLLLLCGHATLPGTATEQRFYAVPGDVASYLVLIALFVANTALFVPLGEQIGDVFGRLPPLRAYSWDLVGSACGTACFGAFSVLFFSPVLGMTLVAVIALALMPRRQALVSAPLLVACLVALAASGDPRAIWSPYYVITLRDSDPAKPGPVSIPADVRTMRDPPIYQVSVNQDFYQLHGTLDERRYASRSHQADLAATLRDQFLLPDALAAGRGRALVLGSGGGMDVEACLLSGFEHVDAVDIDPRLVELSRRASASAVYDDERVTVHVDDARAFVQRAEDRYDLVVFGFLDSQALFSSMSNLRLDGFTYTVEGVRQAYGLLDDDGVLALSFAAGHEWLARKILNMVAQATGGPPLVYVSGRQIVVVATRARGGAAPAAFGRFAAVEYPADALLESPPPTDDWPFLYLSRRGIPRDYQVVIGVLLALSLGSVGVLRRSAWTLRDGQFFFLGLGFLLLEVKSIGDCSLYFGATWLVTTLVILGVLLMVLGANAWAARLPCSRWLYLPLFVSLAILQAVPEGWVLSQPMAGRIAWTVFAVPMPVLFAGLVFSTRFRGARNAGSLFGANLLGAVVGGFCEYAGMATGRSALTLMVIAASALRLAFEAWERPARARADAIAGA